jgi:hypothetical protein
MVFPVKYRKGLLDEAVTAIIQETAAEIAERFPIEMEAMSTYGQESYPSALQRTSEFDANQAISTILLERASRRFHELYPRLKKLRCHRVAFFAYPLSGGFEHPSFLTFE